MADGIEDIYVRLSVETNTFFGQVDKAVSGATSRLGRIGSFLTSSAVQWGTAIAGAAAGFASFQGIKDAVARTQELGLAVDKMRRETGLSAESSSRLIHAFEHVGLTADDASRSIGILAKKLKGVQDEETGVTTGGKSTAQILADVGVKATDASGNLLALDEIMGPLADRFQAMPDGLEKTGLAMQLFGRSGKDMIPLLNLGAAGLAELGAEADKLGVTLSAKNVEIIKAYTYAQRDLSAALTGALTGIKLQVGLALMPVLTQFFNWLISIQPAAREWAQSMIDAGRAIAENVSPVVRTLVADLRDFAKWLDQNRTALTAFGLGLGALVAIAHPLLAIIAGLTVAIELYRTNMDDLSPTMAKVKAAIDPLVAGLAQVGDALLTVGNWLLQHQAAMVAAIVGIGIAFTWANPLIAVLIGAGGLVYALGLLNKGATDIVGPLDEAGRAAVEVRAKFLEMALSILEAIHAVQLFSPLLALLGPVGIAAALSLAVTYDEVGAAISNVKDQLAETRAATDAYDANPIVSQLGHILQAAANAGAGLLYLQKIAYQGVSQVGISKELLGMTPEERLRAVEARLQPAAPVPPTVTPPPEITFPDVGDVGAAKDAVVDYTETLDELTKTLLGLGRAAGMTDEQLAGFPWTLDLARKAAERLNLTTDDLLDIFNRTGAGFADFMRELAASEALDQLKQIADAVTSSLSDLRNQFNTLFGQPTREQAAINLQLAQLKLRRAQMVATGATDEALAGIDKEIARIEAVNTVRQAEVDVMRAQLDMADKTLLTDADQYSQARTLVGKMADLSTAAQPVIDLYRQQAELMKPWLDAMNQIIFWEKAVPLPSAEVAPAPPAPEAAAPAPAPEAAPLPPTPVTPPLIGPTGPTESGWSYINGQWVYSPSAATALPPVEAGAVQAASVKMGGLAAAAQPVIDLYAAQADEMKGWVDSVKRIILMGATLALPGIQALPSMGSGGIVPGPRGQPQLIVAHGGEPVLPLGSALSFSMPVAINIEQGADWMEITRKAHEAVTEALHEARTRSYLRGAPLGSGIG